MGKDIVELKKSLEQKVRSEENFQECVKILKKIIEDFDLISKKISFSFSKDRYYELVTKNCKSYKNKIAIGLNIKGLRYDIMKEHLKQKVLQDYRSRNWEKWKQLEKFGLPSWSAIAWAVAHRRKAIPVFLSDDELRRFGYRSGWDEPKEDYWTREEAKYYDTTICPPPMPSPENRKYYGVRLTEGMRNQSIFLLRAIFAEHIQEKNVNEKEFENINISLWKNPDLLLFLFESVRTNKLKNDKRISELENELVLIYDNLSKEKQKEHIKTIEALNLAHKIGKKMRNMHLKDKWAKYRKDWVDLRASYSVKEAFQILREKYPNDQNLKMVKRPEYFNRAINDWYNNH